MTTSEKVFTAGTANVTVGPTVGTTVTEAVAMPTWFTGVIKWFDQVRRYGFIVDDEDGGDIFLPWTVLQESEIPERAAKIGTKVRYRCVPPERAGKNPRATHVVIVQKAK